MSYPYETWSNEAIKAAIHTNKGKLARTREKLADVEHVYRTQISTNGIHLLRAEIQRLEGTLKQLNLAYQKRLTERRNEQ